MSIPEMSTDIPWSLVKSGFGKTPIFNTAVQTPASGRGITAVSFQPYPRWRFTVDLNYIRGGEAVQFSVLQKFLGCFIACKGRGTPFYFTDPLDTGVSHNGVLLNATPGASAPMSTTGDGVSRVFQLARQIDQGTDIPDDIVSSVVFVNGTANANVTTTENGVVTFSSAPGAGAVLSWQGQFRYRCRFTEDSVQDLARVSKNPHSWLWSASSIEFESEPA